MEIRSLLRGRRIEAGSTAVRLVRKTTGGEIVITEILEAEHVVTELAAGTKEEALAELAARAAERHRDIDRDQLLQTLRERESQASTGLGDGVAIPHARLAGLHRMIAVFARSSAGIDWDAPDGRPAHLVLLLAGPADQPGTYLKTLAGASRLLRESACRERLMNAGGEHDILGVLRTEEGRNGAAAA
jgi:mannitol/fructose-specific phosphotransferase system IIA component (Ntr-type)